MRLRRCPSCKHHLTRWGGRLFCANAQCVGSPIHEHDHDDHQEVEQLQLPLTTKEAA